ncbi:SERTA domain-containing protein 3 [Marasmius sp. AFHP31]|nr:SERTA domain-containing protein 3 [Marasmius sp. AFHP31]
MTNSRRRTTETSHRTRPVRVVYQGSPELHQRLSETLKENKLLRKQKTVAHTQVESLNKEISLLKESLETSQQEYEEQRIEIETCEADLEAKLKRRCDAFVRRIARRKKKLSDHNLSDAEDSDTSSDSSSSGLTFSGKDGDLPWDETESVSSRDLSESEKSEYLRKPAPISPIEGPVTEAGSTEESEREHKEIETRSPVAIDGSSTNTGTGEAWISSDHEKVFRAPNSRARLASFPEARWFEPAFSYLNADLGEPYGARYLELLDHWVRIERLQQKKNKQGFGKRGIERPQEIDLFAADTSLKRWDSGPEIDSQFALDFGKRLKNWWAQLQPNWKERPRGKDDMHSPKGDVNWESLDKAGRNGWALLVISMKWWANGIVVMDDEVIREKLETEWILTIDDMLQMASGLIEHLERE